VVCDYYFLYSAFVVSLRSSTFKSLFGKKKRQKRGINLSQWIYIKDGRRRKSPLLLSHTINEHSGGMVVVVVAAAIIINATMKKEMEEEEDRTAP
jgi:hypothetical protein